MKKIKSLNKKIIKLDQRSSELNEEIEKISKELIAKNKFLHALERLMLLSKNYYDSPLLWLNIAYVYTRMANWNNAIACSDTAILLSEKKNPLLLPKAKQLKALALFSLGKKVEGCSLIDEALKASPNNSGAWLLRAYLYGHTYTDPMIARDAAREWGKRFADPMCAKNKAWHGRDKTLHRKLKIAYVTADFREHSVAFFMRPIIENHDRENYEIFVFSNGPEDKVSELIKPHVDKWYNILNLSDKEANNIIASEYIDILVDLSGFTHGHRLNVFAQKPAPIQVTWLGYLLTLGMKAIDYRLVSPDTTPPEQQKYYEEKLFQLNHSSTYRPPEYSPFCQTPPLIRNGYPTLLSLNSSAKITDEMLMVWSEILSVRKDAKLIIMVKEANAEAAAENMLPRVVNAKMPLDRVSVLHQQPLNRFMEMGHVGDILLDTSPVSAGTTALHALWMGLQVVTMDAERSVDASGARALKRVGAGGFIVKSKEEYIEAALNLMSDSQRMVDHRNNIRRVMLSCPYMDYKERVKDLEKAYRIMWANWVLPGEKHYDLKVNVEELGFGNHV